jgi:hypothetical protein
MLFITIGAIIYFLQRARGGTPVKLRRLPQIDVIDEIVDRCVEMNKECWFIPGQGRMINAFELPAIISTFGMLAYTTRKCAENGAGIHCVSVLPIAYNIQAEIMREAYELAGKPEEFDPLETIIYIPNGAERPYIVNESWRRKPAGGILVGGWYHQTIIFCEALQRAGAMTLGGTDTIHNIPFMVAANNYSLIGEEMFAMSAYLSEDPLLGSSLAGQDIGKYLVLILCIIGVLAGLVGIQAAEWYAM